MRKSRPRPGSPDQGQGGGEDAPAGPSNPPKALGVWGLGVLGYGSWEVKSWSSGMRILKLLNPRTIYDPPAKARIMQVGHLVVAARSLYGPSIEPGH